MNFRRTIAGAANDPIFTGPDDAVAGFVTNVGTLGGIQQADYLPNHAASIVGLPDQDFDATITYGDKETVVQVPTVYLGENPHYSSILTGLAPDQGYLKGAVIAIEIGVLYQISEMRLKLNDKEKTQMIEMNVRAFLEQEKARMEEYILNIERQDIVSRNQKKQINILKETINRIGAMVTAPVIERVKSQTESIQYNNVVQVLDYKKSNSVEKVQSSVAGDILGVLGFKGGKAANDDTFQNAA